MMATQVSTTPPIDFISELKFRGITRGSWSWSDYETGKLIINRIANSSSEYDELIAELTEYLKV